MTKLTALDTLTATYASVAKLNTNFSRLTTAINNTLSRDGSSPNGMSASIDMDSNRIINLPTPINNHDAVNKAYTDGLAFTGGSSFFQVVADISELKALDITDYPVSTQVFVTDTRQAGGFVLTDSAYSGDDVLTVAPTTVSANLHWARVIQDKIFLSWWGAPASITQTFLQAAIDASPNKTLVFESNGTYSITGTITQTAKTHVDFAGATLTMNLANVTKGWQLLSNTTLKNGTILAVTTGSGGSGEHRTPFCIGDYNSGTGYNNISIHHMGFNSDKAGGAIGLILGNSYNILISDITIPDNATLGQCVVFHWGGATDPTLGTYHPHNCRVERVKVGALSWSNPSDSGYLDAGLFGTSGAFNVVFSDIEIAYAVNHAFYSYAGDNGTLYSEVPAAQVGFSKYVNSGILYENCVVRNMIDNENTSGSLQASVCKVRGDRTTSSAVEVMGVEFKNIRSEFLAGAPANLTNGVHVLNADSPKVTDCRFANFKNGVFSSRTGALYNRNLQVQGGIFQDALVAGIYLQHTAHPIIFGVTATGSVAGIEMLSGTLNPVVSENECYNNSAYGIYSDAIDAVISNNQLGVTGGSQDVGIRVAANGLRTKLVGNSCLQATTAAYTLGVALDAFRDNSVVSGTTLVDDTTKLPIGSSAVLVGAPVALTTATAKTITSLDIGNGVWLASGIVVFDLDGTTVATNAAAAIFATADTLPTIGATGMTVIPAPFTTGADIALSTGSKVLTVVDGSDTYRLNCKLTFTVSTAGAYGTIEVVKVG